MDNIKKLARQYLAKRFSVIPVGKDKRPLIKWEEFQKRRPTEQEVEQWFQQWPDANIAIIAGQISGLAVIDFDSPEALEFGKSKGLSVTPMVKTFRGFHAYFKFQEGVRNFQKRDDLPGIDLRGEGGYAVLPPSVHANGTVYTWCPGQSLDDLPLANLPEWVMVKHESEKTPLKELYKGVPDGSRNMSLARLVGSWANDGLTLDECLKMGQLWNQQNVPPDEEHKVIATVKSIYFKHQREKAKSVEAREAREALGSIPLVQFDFSVFSKPIQDLILKIAEAYSINPEPVAVMMLAILSAAIGNTARVSPKEGWEEPVFIWAMITGESGVGKTPFASKLLKPVHELQGLARHMLPMGVGSTFDVLNNITLQPQYLVSDITIEALAVVLNNNPRGVLAYFDELAGFIKSHDKYSKGNDRQKYLELWSCQPWQVNRIGRGNLYVKDTGLSIGGGIQLGIIPNVFDKFSMDDGLLPRFLFSLVKDNIHYSESAVTDQDIAIWYDLVIGCYRIPLQKDHNGHVVHTVLKLTPDAHQIFGEFSSRFRKLGYYASNTSLKVFIPKLISYALRIAGILHVIATNNLQESIDAGTMANSIKLVEYFLSEVRKVLFLYAPKGPKSNLNEKQIHLIRVLWVLKDLVHHGMLLTERIMVEFNHHCHPSIKLKDEQATSYALRELNLSTKTSGGHSHLIWEPEKIQKLFNSQNPL
jgi:hypothetical protein